MADHLASTVERTDWWRAAGVRAVKTMAQTALAMVSVGALVTDIDWLAVASASALSGIYSVLTSLAGLPEAPRGGDDA